jgi:beta propeller repeat protein
MLARTHALHRPNRALNLLALLAMLAGLFALPWTGRAPAVPLAAPPLALPDFGALPLAFQPNAGQAPPAVRFVTHAAGGTLSFLPTEVALTLESAPPAAPGPPAAPAPTTVRLQFLGAGAATITGGAELPGKVNYLLGNDQAHWRTNLPTYGDIRYQDLYPGITLSYAGQAGRLKGTYSVAPGADPARIRWRYTGTGTAVDAQGNLQIAVPGASAGARLTEAAPVAWQDTPAGRVPVSARYTLAADGAIGFALGAYDRARSLTIDPTLTYATYLGGSATDNAYGVAVDSSGAVYVVGTTSSTNFPVVNPYQGDQPQADAFVTKIDPAGTAVVYSTYLGGGSTDQGFDIAVDSAGQAYLVGATTSLDFPTLNGAQPAPLGRTDAYLAKLSSDGATLLYATYAGGSVNDYATGVAVDEAGTAYLAGTTNSPDIFIEFAYQYTYGGGATYGDAFLERINTNDSGSPSLVYSTYLGGAGEDYLGAGTGGTGGHGIAVDNNGIVALTGTTHSTNFPTLNGYQSSNAGSADAWAARIDTNLQGTPSLLYSTYLGGSGIGAPEGGHDIALDSQGGAYITGDSTSADFPTRTPYAPCTANDAPFVAKLNMSLSGAASLVYATCFGAGGTGTAAAIAVDGAGRAFVTGSTNSPAFPVPNGVQTSLRGPYDAFVLRLSASGQGLLYGTYLGGSIGDSGSEHGYGIAVDGAGAAYVVGQTGSNDFPVQNALDPTYNGVVDGFIAKITDPAGTPPPPAAPIASGPGDQGAPRVSGHVVVWEDNSQGTWDILARDLDTLNTFAVYRGPADQRHPAIDGDLVVWEDNRNGDWDIYGARIVVPNDTAGPAFAVYAAPGDQTSPAAGGNHVVWQTTAAVGARVPFPVGRWDIQAADLDTSQVITLTNSSTTNTNPAIDGDLVVWQTTTPTSTLNVPFPVGRWDIGGYNLAFGGPVFVPGSTDDKTNPSVSGSTVVWQEYMTPTTALQAPAPVGRWGVSGADVSTGITFTVAGGNANVENPAISGRTVVFQDQDLAPGAAPAPVGRWDIGAVSLDTGGEQTISNNTTDATEPDIDGNIIVWQQVSPNGDLDVYGNVCTANYSDVLPTDYFYTPVQWLACRGVLSGYADHTFRPGNYPTRGQLSKLVVLGEGWPTDTTGGPHFSDVPTDYVYYSVIETAVNHGIISVYADHTVRPGADVTRGQLCKIIVGAQGWAIDTTGGPHFTDVPPGSPFYTFVETAVNHGIISGYADHTFRPGNSATRGQIAKIVYGALNPQP